MTGGRILAAIRLPRYSSSVPARTKGTMGAPVRNASSPDPPRTPGHTRSGGPMMAPSMNRHSTAFPSSRPWAARTWTSTPPPRQTGRMPPVLRSSRSFHGLSNAVGALPRNQTRGSIGSARKRNQRIDPAAMQGRRQDVATFSRQVLATLDLDLDRADAVEDKARPVPAAPGRAKVPSPTAAGAASRGPPWSIGPTWRAAPVAAWRGRCWHRHPRESAKARASDGAEVARGCR